MDILLIDDDMDQLEDLKSSLMPLNHNFQLETSATTALTMYKNKKFDIVITDLRMPDMSGIELLKYIRDFDPKAIVIIITAYAELDDAIEAINNRGYAFFKKPIDFEKLITTIKEIEKKI